MRILTRLVMVLVLLGVLAYGSYGLGKYVLSNKLFGNSVTPVEGSVLEAEKPKSKKNVPGQVPITGKPHVEVDILPADEAEPGPEIPSIASLQKTPRGRSGSSNKKSPSSNSNTQSARRESTTREFSTNDPTPKLRSGYDSSGDGRSYRADSSDDEDRPRRRRRRQYSDDDNSRSSERTTSRRRRRRRSSSSSNDSPVPRAESSRSRRSESRSSRPSRSERSESPVPRPEGAPSRSDSSGTLGGSESPIPQPE
jgi:hypothetical protein